MKTHQETFHPHFFPEERVTYSCVCIIADAILFISHVFRPSSLPETDVLQRPGAPLLAQGQVPAASWGTVRGLLSLPDSSSHTCWWEATGHVAATQSP